MIRYSRACGSYQDFLDRGMLLTRKLLNQGFLLVKLKALLVYARHGYVPLVVSTTTKDRVTRIPLQTEGERRCTGSLSSSCSNSDTNCVNLVTNNPVISHACRKDPEVLTTTLRHLQPLLTINSVFHIMLIIRYNDMQDLELSKFRVRLVVCSS
jgi:hypothetical protein